jgi:hypothetical protein
MQNDQQLAIPKTASEWELNLRVSSANFVADTLGKLLENKIMASKNAGRFNFRAAERIRDQMYLVMNAYRHFGAREAKSECVLTATLEKAFNLETFSLAR